MENQQFKENSQKVSVERELSQLEQILQNLNHEISRVQNYNSRTGIILNSLQEQEENPKCQKTDQVSRNGIVNKFYESVQSLTYLNDEIGEKLNKIEKITGGSY